MGHKCHLGVVETLKGPMLPSDTLGEAAPSNRVSGAPEGAAWHSAWGFGIYSSTDLFPFFTPGYLEVCLHRRKGRGFSDEFLAGT